MGKRVRTTAMAAVLTLFGGVLGAVPAALVTSAPAGAVITTDDLTTGATATQLAQSLAGSGVTVSNVTYTGAPVAAGSFAGGAGVGFDTGVVLSSGRVQSAPGAVCTGKGVEGPNSCTNNTTANGTAGDAALTALAGVGTFDAAILQFDFVPQFATVQFEYVFGSEEYLEFVNAGVNDVFGFFVNGVNCATVPGTEGTPVSVDTINTGLNSEFFRNNASASIDTELDGLTTVLECNAAVTPGVANTLRLAIADGGDEILDSDVFLRAGSLVSGTQVTGSLTGGDESGTSISVPAGTSVTAQATLSGVNSPSAGGTATYSVFSNATCTTSAGSGGTKAVVGGAVPASDAVALATPGTYYWRIAYSGDPLNNPSSTACGELVETVTAPVSQLEITSEGQPSSVTAGASALRIITVTNTGEGTASDVSVDLTLPPGTTLVRTTPSQGTCGGVVGGVVTCELGDLAASASANVRFVVGTPSVIPPSGSITTSATAAADGGDPADPAESTTTLVPPTPGQATGYVPPGGTLSTGTNATAGDNTVASFTLPNTGEGAVISITSAPCAPGVCNGRTMTYTPFTGYDDPTEPVRFAITWDKSVKGTGLFSQLYVLKENETNYALVLPCQKPGERRGPALARFFLGLLFGGRTGIAQPAPCVDEKQQLRNGDVRIEALALSGDPSWRRR